jgi:aminoglycoside phosphotransferase (APT) family kinase protein
VSEWLTANVVDAQPPYRFSLITGGHSNLTYRVVDGKGDALVLRRPPLGKLLATAHDMAREHRIVSAIGPTAVPVPPTLGLCEDLDVNDAPFYVMKFVDGHVLHTAPQTADLFDEAERGRIGASVIQVLADLHNLDPDEIGLGTLGKKQDYIQRQLKRWTMQWEGSKTRELPAMERVGSALRAQIPEQVGACVVHGDYRLGNMITGADATISAVLDWELCTLGDPLADVGYLLNNWAHPGETGESSPEAAPPPSAASGFPSRSEFLARYSELTGRDTTKVAYYRAFQYWRLAAICEGVLDRYLKGKMGGTVDTDLYKLRVEQLAASAVEMIDSL